MHCTRSFPVSLPVLPNLFLEIVHVCRTLISKTSFVKRLETHCQNGKIRS